jgi:hypothetical protein
MSTSAPTMTSMLATAPATYSAYAAAPTMTSMYANPQAASMYASPAAYQQPSIYTAAPQTFVAPATSTIVAQPTARAPSYVAAPVQQYVEEVIAPVGYPGFAVAAPQSLTAGLVPPAKVEAERLGYEKALATQLDKQVNATLEEAKIKKAMLKQTADTQMAQYQLQIDENYKMACLQVDQEKQNLINGLREAAITQQTAREETAAIAVADYNKKKALEDMAAKSYQLQKTWYDNEMRLTAEYQKVMKAGSKSVITPSMPVAPVAGVI